MKAHVITFGQSDRPSTRYRILEFLPLFAQAGDEVNTTHKLQMKIKDLQPMQQADVVVCQKSLMGPLWRWGIRKKSKRLIFDWDDAFWTRPGKPYGWITQLKVNGRLRSWLKAADAVTCANEYLADYSRRFNSNVHVIPMSLDLDAWTPPADQRNPHDPFIIGWAGSSGNMHYLKLCDKAIGEFLKTHPNARFHVMCNKKPQLQTPFEFFQWSADTEKAFFANLSVGLLPLDQNELFTLGKSPTKGLQYMSMGVPVVGNMLEGGAADIAKAGGCICVKTQQDWIEAFESLQDKEIYNKLRQDALNNVRANHDMKRVFQTMQEIWFGAPSSTQ